MTSILAGLISVVDSVVSAPASPIVEPMVGDILVPTTLLPNCPHSPTTLSAVKVIQTSSYGAAIHGNVQRHPACRRSHRCEFLGSVTCIKTWRKILYSP